MLRCLLKKNHVKKNSSFKYLVYIYEKRIKILSQIVHSFYTKWQIGTWQVKKGSVEFEQLLTEGNFFRWASTWINDYVIVNYLGNFSDDLQNKKQLLQIF